jgi:DNA polymerase-1
MPEATLDDIPREVAVRYAARDADATLRIYPILSGMIDSGGLREVYEIDMGIIPMIDRMHTVGMLIDVPHFQKLEKHLTTEMSRTQDKIKQITGYDINPASGDQTAMLLTAVGIKLTRMTKGGQRESTNDKILESFRSHHPAVGLVCDYRELAKLRDTFCVVLPKLVHPDGRIRCDFRITRVSSGRLAASHPNLLGIPVRSELGKEIRRGFVAAPGHVLGSWDLDQIEMRVMADESQDPTLCRAFLDGVDVHRLTGAMMFGKKPDKVTTAERYAAKRVGFGILYGISAGGLRDQMHMAGQMDWTEESCQEAIDAWFKMYPKVRSYFDLCTAEARRYGYVRDRWGRIRYLPGVNSDIPRIREEANRQSVSHKIQAGAQGLIKRAMKEIWQMKKKMTAHYVEPLLQIHDELLFEVDDSEGFKDSWSVYVVAALCNVTKLRVPVKAKGGYGGNWGELKD